MGTLSPNKGYQIPTIGGDAGPTYANEINATLGIIDTNMGGVNSLSVAGSLPVTLTTGQAQNLIQQFTGALTGNITVYLPPVGSFYCIENATTGNFTLNVGCTGGTNVFYIPQGLSKFVWTDGTFTRESNPNGWLEIGTTVVTNSGAVTNIALPGPFRKYRMNIQELSSTVNGDFLGFEFVYGTSVASPYVQNVFDVYGNGTSAVNASGSVTVPGITNFMFVNNFWEDTFEIWPAWQAIKQFPTLRGHSWGVTTALGTPYVSDMHNFAFTAIPAGIATSINFAPQEGGLISGTFILEGLP